MLRILNRAEQWSRGLVVAACLGLLAVIGWVDYLAGFQILFSVFYLLEVALAAWFLGWRFGLVMSVLSVGVWIGGDVAAGARYTNPLVPIWNALILLVFYSIVVWLLTSVRNLQRQLEARVEERTRELRREMSQRQRLEEEILKVSEREQRRIGHDLHDGLCQHLTATALAGQVLAGKLRRRDLPEATDARKVVSLVEEGINLARGFARGLYPVEMEAEGLMAAFQQLADNITRSTRTQCVFECDPPVLIHDDAAATHLYRIAQEAVLNALRHGKPTRIGINLQETTNRIKLSVEDDGTGLPDPPQPAAGLGIRIMAYRAAMIHGIFAIEPAPTGGTIVTVSFPKSAAKVEIGRNEQHK
jgi:signal transduction histidine kinase